MIVGPSASNNSNVSLAQAAALQACNQALYDSARRHSGSIGATGRTLGHTDSVERDTLGSAIAAISAYCHSRTPTVIPEVTGGSLESWPRAVAMPLFAVAPPAKQHRGCRSNHRGARDGPPIVQTLHQRRGKQISEARRHRDNSHLDSCLCGLP